MAGAVARPRRTAAQAQLSEIERRAAVVTTLGADQLRGQYIDPTDRTTFRAYAEAWRAAQAHRPTTQAHVETHLRRHAYPVFGARRLATILPSEVQAWTAGLTAAGLAPSTVQVIHGIVASVFKAAVRDRKLASSPCETTRLPRKVKARVVPLGTSVVTALVDAMPERLAALVILAAGTGLRQGEAFGLTVDRIDFLRRTLTVDRQLVLLPRQAPYLAPVKTEASNRTVPLPRVVVDALADHLRRYPAGPNGWAFTDDTGAPLRRTAFSREVWHPAVEAAGASAGTGLLSRPGARFRCFHRPVSPGRSPNPPCRSLGNGLSTASAVKRGSWAAMGLGSCCPGSRTG